MSWVATARNWCRTWLSVLPNYLHLIPKWKVRLIMPIRVVFPVTSPSCSLITTPLLLIVKNFKILRSYWLHLAAATARISIQIMHVFAWETLSKVSALVSPTKAADSWVFFVGKHGVAGGNRVHGQDALMLRLNKWWGTRWFLRIFLCKIGLLAHLWKEGTSINVGPGSACQSFLF